ncbi:hypothetical protein [Stenotrophomonas sp. PS02298]|uniref:hypothetical protein n=1 Tax=Stenotrophomonas sp. PS02298 TaxID=2991424 RepID=UPI00249B52F2|nr:hypothetical protein [Stenotrophomonas sp. PS02298]
MASTWCLPPNSGAYNLVGDAHTKFTNKGDELYKLVVDGLTDMDDVGISPIEFNVNFDFEGQLTPFTRPLAPTLDAAAFEMRLPAEVALPPVFVPGAVEGAPAPEFTAEMPTLSFGARPTRPDIVAPRMPDDPEPLVMPVAPDAPLPQLPTFEQLNLPTLPDIDLPEFNGQLPQLVEPPFDDNWTFQPEAYVSRLKDQLFGTIERMLQSKPALPEVIEAAIFQKGRSRQEVETGREVEQAITEFGSRGWNVPNGTLTAQVREIRQRGQDRIADFNREAVIKQYEETLQNLRLALAQGAALEGVYINLHVEEQRFALEAARFAREATMTVLQYRLSVYQTRMQGYQIEAQVMRDRIQAELAKVEIFKAQLDGERLRGEVNEQRVRLYAEQIRAVGLMADFYRTQVEAVKAKADVQRLVFDRYKTAVDGFDSRWKAHVSEWQGYIASVEGEGKRADIYRTQMDVQSKRVDAWATSENLKLEHERLRTQQFGQQLSAWQALIAKRESELSAERSRLAAVSSLVDAKARLYSASASVEQAASAASDRSFELGLARSRARMDAGGKNAELMLQQAKFLTDQLLSVNDTKLKVAAQLTAASWSAVNYSAGVSASVGQSSSCSQSFNFNGETSDA